MVDSQRVFIHTIHGIMSRDSKDFVFFYILCIVTRDESESRSNGKLTKDFHPHHTCDYVQGFLDFVFFLYFVRCDNRQK